MALRDYIIPLMVFTGVVVGLSIFAVDYADSQNKDIEDVSEDFTIVTDIQDQAEAIKDSIQDAQITGIPFLDTPFIVVSALFTIVKLMTTTLLDIWFGFFGQVALVLGLPSWFVDLITAAITIVILLEFVSWAHKRRT